MMVLIFLLSSLPIGVFGANFIEENIRLYIISIISTHTRTRAPRFFSVCLGTSWLFLDGVEQEGGSLGTGWQFLDGVEQEGGSLFWGVLRERSCSGYLRSLMVTGPLEVCISEEERFIEILSSFSSMTMDRSRFLLEFSSFLRA